jgi:hypothetical protein
LLAIKDEIFGDGGGAESKSYAGNRIDRHKITALYIQLFLENPVFAVNMDSGYSTFPSWDTMLINEMFCLDIVDFVLSDWDDKVFDFDKFQEYKIVFLKLLYYYKKHSELNRVNSFFTHALAHLIYFIERDFCHKA